jgi:hypothetical protein
MATASRREVDGTTERRETVDDVAGLVVEYVFSSRAPR